MVHFVFLILYAAAAVAAARYLPAMVPAFVPSAGVAYGAAVLGALAAVHAAAVGMAAHWARRAAQREVEAVRDSYSEVMRELGYARAEVLHIHDALEAARKVRASKTDIAEVANEVETLRRQIDQLNAATATTRRRRNGAAKAVPSVRANGNGNGAAKSEGAAAPLDDARILEIVREAIDMDRVDLYLQPIVSLPQRKHRFYECFSRIRDEAGNVIMPEQYLEVAEREGLIAAIDNVLLIRCVQLVRKVQKHRRNVGFFVNISPHTLADGRFFNEFIAFMGENAELAPNLVFEFSQADVPELSGETAKQLYKLGAMGFRFSMDRIERLDLNYPELSRRFFRYIKIDSSTLFGHLNDLPEDDEGRSFKALLDSNGIDAIVERVEEEPQVLELLDYGIDFGQGYLFGEPKLPR